MEEIESTQGQVILERLFPPDKYGEDSDIEVIWNEMHQAELMRLCLKDVLKYMSGHLTTQMSERITKLIE